MEIGVVVSLIFIAFVALLLVKKANAIAVLLFSGLAMLVVAYLIELPASPLKNPTHLPAFDFVQYVVEALGDTVVGVGLVIMIISGFVAYMDKIGASDELAYLALKPLSLFKKYPYVLATLVVPIGQFLFISITSAAGLGLLLMATVFPIMINLGVSRLTAASLITATTAFGIGPASAIALSASQVLDLDISVFFFKYQVPMVVLLSATVSLVYYFTNIYYDKKLQEKGGEDSHVFVAKEKKADTPKVYALLPVLPLIILLVFSESFNLFTPAIRVDTNIAMLLGLATALVFEAVRTRDFRGVLGTLDVFWNGMGDIFKSVVTLIVAADIFSKGLISLGFIDGLVAGSSQVGLGGMGIGIVMTVMIFLASVLMGSGNAAFFAFGPLVPQIARPLGLESVKVILPMSFAAAMGRTISPIAGVLVAVSALAKVSPVDVVKRNLIPFTVALLLMLTVNFL
jgi:C4-dicarboxylate transporter, DcuC family